MKTIKKSIFLTLSMLVIGAGTIISQYHVHKAYSKDLSNKETLKLESIKLNEQENNKTQNAEKNLKLESTQLTNKIQLPEKQEGKKESKKEEKTDTEDLKWHTDVNAGFIGCEDDGPVRGPSVWTSGIKFDPADISHVNGQNITTLSFKYTGLTNQPFVPSGEIKIWQGPNESNLTLVHSQNIDAELIAAQNSSFGWVDVTIDQTVSIDASEELYATIEWDTQGLGVHTATYDEGTPNPKGDLTIFGSFPQNSWNRLANMLPGGGTGNWMIELETSGSETLAWHIDGSGTRLSVYSSNWESGILFEVDDLVDLDGMEITNIRMLMGELPTAAVLRIYQGPDIDNMSQVRVQTITAALQANQWNEIELNNPYLVDINQELLITVRWNNPDADPPIKPLGYDDASIAAGTLEEGKGNLLNFPGYHHGWRNVNDYDSDYQGNWMKEIILEPVPEIYNILFNVMNEDLEPIHNATARVEGNANAAGNYLFDGFGPGLYQYEVTKTGYVTVNDYVLIVDEDVEEDVIMVRDDTSVDIVDEMSLSVYPNPANDIINIKSDNNIKRVKILDITGKTMYSNLLENKDHAIDISNFNNGLYIIQIDTATDSKIKKIQVVD